MLKMEKMFIQTDQGIREYTQAEYDLAAADREAERLELERLVEVKAQRQAALAKLEALGLTVEDLRALGL